MDAQGYYRICHARHAKDLIGSIRLINYCTSILVWNEPNRWKLKPTGRAYDAQAPTDKHVANKLLPYYTTALNNR